MANYDDWRQMKNIEEMAKNSKLYVASSHFGNDVGLFTQSDELPFYVDDSLIYLGNFDQIEAFLHGLEWLNQYHRNMLKLVTDKKVNRKEQDERNRQLMQRITHTEEK